MALISYKQELTLLDKYGNSQYEDTVSGRFMHEQGIRCLHTVMQNMLQLFINERCVRNTDKLKLLLSKYNYFLKTDLNNAVYNMNNYGRFIEYYSDAVQSDTAVLKVRLSLKLERGC